MDKYIGEEMHNDGVTKIGALQYAQLEDSYQIICKKYSLLKQEFMNTLWNKAIHNDKSLSFIPKQITEDISKYQISYTLGKGSFATVYALSYEDKMYAAKVIKKSNIKKYKQLERLSREIEILKSINHENVIEISEVLNTTDALYIIFNTVSQDLFEVMARKRLNNNHVKQLYTQLSAAINHLHKSNIIHRDIKPENMLFIEETHGKVNIKLIDFGLAEKTKSEQNEIIIFKDFCGSPGFFAPDLLLESGYTEKIDIWSSGCTLLEAIIGSNEFNKKWLPNYAPLIIKDANIFKEKISKTISDFLKITLKKSPFINFLKSMLSMNSEERCFK